VNSPSVDPTNTDTIRLRSDASGIVVRGSLLPSSDMDFCQEVGDSYLRLLYVLRLVVGPFGLSPLASSTK